VLKAEIEAQAGQFVLQAALEVEAGQTVVLFGRSGAGKSLLLRALAGIHHPVAGKIELNGQVLLDTAHGIDQPPQVRRLGYVAQSYALFPHLTVRENVAFGLHAFGSAERRQRTDSLLHTLQLEGLADRRPAQLSGGQQQRVALARALAIEPRALLLDEPFAALDAPLRRLLRRELQTLRHRYGFSMVFVTHDLGDACALADRIAVLERGQIVQVGTPSEILYRPAPPVVARLTGMRNVFPARVVAAVDGGLQVVTDRFAVRTRPYPFQIGAAVDLYVRPEHVVLIRPEHEHDPRRENLVRGQIVDETHLGPVHTLYLRLSLPHNPSSDGEQAGAGYDLEVDIAPHPYQALRVAERREWLLSLAPEGLHLTAPGSATIPE
jgi:molybdate transport system ATP-binding protein